MTNYRRGRDFENRVKKVLEAKGYFVLRSAGSKSPVDLAAMKDGKAVFVQCKMHGVLGVAEWNSFYDLCEEVGAMPVLASKECGAVALYAIKGRKDGKGGRQPMEVLQ